MKYFSIEDWKTWEPWDRILANEKRYKDYVQTIRHRLPPDLQRLCDFSPVWNEERISLNDSRLSQISASYAAQTVTLVLDGHYSNTKGNRIGQRLFTLNYAGITTLRITAGSESADNPGPDWEPQTEASAVQASASIAFDDHGGDEIELIEDGLFEHRMLFASGTETAIQFRDFMLETVDTPYAKAAK